MVEGVAIVLAYLWGAVPTAYLVGRLRRGIDIRQHGTGNVGASNIIRQVGMATGLGLGLFDGLAKGTLPVVAAKLLGLGPAAQVGIALAAVAGHNWSPYLRFAGGRGVATAMGAYVGFGLWQQLLAGTIIVGLLGWLILRNLALWMVIGMALMVPLAYLLHQPPEIVYVLLGLLLLVLLKRVTGNWSRPMAGEPWPRVLLYRLLFDRDVAERGRWLSRRPNSDSQGREP